MIFDGEGEQRAARESFDYVIVGSGAAGATAARMLADTGAAIAILEEGPAVSTPQLNDQLFPSIRRLFRDMLTQVAWGRALIPIIQGCCLGGSTVVNSAIVWRIPDDVWEPWKNEFGLGEALPLDELQQCWDKIEEELNVHPTPPDIWGENNRLMDVARAKMPVSAGPTRRNESGCRGSARCLTGCPYGAKQSMLVSYVPYAEKRGAAVFTSARADTVLWDGDSAIGVRGHFRNTSTRKDTAPFRIRARKAVIVAASAIQSPGLLHRSGVRSRHLGRHFQGHPGTTLTGIFDHKVGMWFGATQGFDADEHRRDFRCKIESISLPPEMVLARMPGAGRQWLQTMAEAPYAATWAVVLRAFAEGSVRERFCRTHIKFDLEDRDMDNLRKGLRFTAEFLFAAGAREVITGIHGLPERLRRPEEAKVLENGPKDPAAYSFIMSHLFGTTRMSLSPTDGVVGPDFCVHGTKNLYVVDSSIFPTNLGVNPQHPIMGVAMHATKKIIEGQG